MPNNINISDYEKIIFVNNIDENNSNNLSLLTNDNYKSVLFFTNNDETPMNWPTSLWGSKIKNIWYGGQRLNRFVGIDKTKSQLNIDNHIIKLTFDYDSGLLGISELIQLDDIQFVSLSFIDAYTNTNYETDNYNTIINAIDNEFVLSLRFIGTDVNTISNLINIKCESNEQNIRLLNYYDGNVSYDNTEMIKHYRFKIICDTEINTNATNNRLYTINPINDDNVSLDINLTLRLNPTSLEVKNYRTGNLASSITYNDGDVDNYAIYIKPNNEKEYTYPLYNAFRKLYVKISSSDADVATINGNSEIYLPVVENNFKLFTLNLNNSSSVNKSSTITVSLVHDNYLNYYSLNLTQSFIVTVNNSAKKWYAGYEDPSLNTFDANLLVELPNESILYDWETSNIIDDTSKDFYVIIPLSEINDIYPCWDAYTVYNDKIYNHFAPPYNTWLTRFDKLSDKNINNVTYAIFKSKVKGKFYGKIQKQ